MSFNETGRPGDPRPTPLTLNTSLRAIYYSLPKADFDLSDVSGPNLGVRLARGLLASINRRKTSSYKELLLRKAAMTIDQSHLSDTGKKLLLSTLSQSYERGIVSERQNL